MSTTSHRGGWRSPATAGAGPIARGRPIRFSYVPALDGLRAISVLGVMLYHGGAPILSGGFLTIDVFFVLSGFLITSLLLGEWAKRVSIRLGQFWARRARRLLPALLVMLIGVAIYAKVFATPGEFADLRLDSLSTLFYVANWHFIASGGNYFDLTAQPSPLAHMWSLSIEEQFYIVWPPVALVMLRLGRRLRPSRRLWPLLATAVFGAIASALDMRLSYQHGASVMRLYEGTDTRCQDILVGAALAIGMSLWAEHRKAVPPGGTRRFDRFVRAHPAAGTTGVEPPLPHRRDHRRRRGPSLKPILAWEISSSPVRVLLQVLGWCALAGAIFLWTQLTGPTAFLFEGGYFLFALGVATVIFCAVTAQTASLARSLGNPVFRYVGKISYGTYLWHFPLFALLDAERMHLYGVPLLTVRIGVTLVVATGVLLPGGGADPPGPDAVVDRMAGVADDQRRLSGRGGRHRGGHRPVHGGGRHGPRWSGPSTPDRRSRWPSSATRWPGDSGSPCWPANPRTPTTWTSTTAPSSAAAWSAAPSTWPTASPTP